MTGHLASTLPRVGIHFTPKLKQRASAADGKLMVGLAAFTPLALGIGAVLEVAAFAMLRLCGRRKAAIPGALWLYLGSLLNGVLLTALEPFWPERPRLKRRFRRLPVGWF